MHKKDGIGFLNKKGQTRPGSDGKGFEDILKEAYDKKESKGAPKITGGIPFFSAFFYWFGKLLRKVFKYAMVIIFLILFLLFLYGLYNYFYRAEQGAVLWEHVKVGVQEQVGVLAKYGLTGIYDIVFRPEKLYTSYSFESDIERNKDNQDLGLRITDLKQVGGNIYSGQPVFVRGTIKAQSLDSPIVASASCSLEDYDGTAEVITPTAESGNKIKIYQGLSQTYTVGCNFPKGIIMPSVNEIAGDAAVPRIAKEVEMSTYYNFVTRASHNTYFLTKGIADSLLAKGVDPFVYYKISDPQLKNDRTVTSKTTIGPINLGIGTFDSQPFSENTPYFFGVSLNNNLNYNGYLKKLDKLEIRLPPNMAVAGESEFGDKGTCDFYYTGNSDENGFKVYYLKDEKLAEIDRQCTLDNLRTLKISFDECANIYQSSFNFMCQFKVVEPIIGDSMYVDFIRGEADYVYETSKKTVVNIIQNPNLLINSQTGNNLIS